MIPYSKCSNHASGLICIDSYFLLCDYLEIQYMSKPLSCWTKSCQIVDPGAGGRPARENQTAVVVVVVLRIFLCRPYLDSILAILAVQALKYLLAYCLSPVIVYFACSRCSMTMVWCWIGTHQCIMLDYVSVPSNGIDGLCWDVLWSLKI